MRAGAGDVVEIRGIFAGDLGALRSVSPVPLVALELPDGFQELPMVERAVWLALLIGA